MANHESGRAKSIVAAAAAAASVPGALSHALGEWEQWAVQTCRMFGIER